MTHVHLAHALVTHAGAVLMVASRYPNHDRPLWNLPGGRQRFGELLVETARRELLEETGSSGAAGPLAYVNESYDGEVHFVAAIFHFEVQTERGLQRSGDARIAAVAWIRFDDVGTLAVPAVVRDPLVAYLRGDLARRYAGRHDAGISIRWSDEA